MEKTEKIENLLESDNVKVIYNRITDEFDALYLNDGSSAYIACAPDIGNNKILQLLAHEAGHHFSGLTGHNGRDEERANRWAAKELIAPIDIVRATINGCQSYHELAEALDLDEDFIKISLQCFRRMYGAGLDLDGYYLNLRPIWVKEIETGRIWPVE